ncbi:TniQ family protein [Pseudomonas aeruginosa]|uniref:TniQ family protein n=1 Tax=Pseudomonas aeruginosa TaxID=287 RepID=UPI000A5ED3F4|nr:TniQ family protein [Pseudomonas aeruginosa]HEC1609944.1 TniQ family protein [Pseudomonas aeruginosa]HEJ4486901.1 TniQ family protein [Pseudomonas aeruginosa]HEJ6090228.1 TniQ family protein [Pseudomonas aeruginosa]
MEASYTWHPGACCLNARWPLTPSILPDEMFSSWLIRTAHAHGCSPNTLTGSVWPRSRAWSVDLDREHPWANLEALSSIVGLSTQAILASTLWQVMHCLHPNSVAFKMGNVPWILPLGCRNRSHAGGLLCCPRCIEKPVPHYLLQFRLAWHTVCPWHRVLLIDHCLKCGAALQPARLRPGRPLSECHHCGQSLATASPEPLVEPALAFQAFADVASQSAALYGGTRLSFSEWMGIARVMISFLQYVIRHPSVSTQRFCQDIGVETSLLRPSSLGLPFEYLAPAERAALLGQAWVIMQAGPERFMEVAARAELAITTFPLPANGAPEILMEMVSALTRRPLHKPGRQIHRQLHTPLEVWRMWHRLQRRTHRNGIS